MLVIEGVAVVELVCPAAASVDEDMTMTTEWGGGDSGHGRSFDSRDFNSRDFVDDSCLIIGGHDGVGKEDGQPAVVRPKVKPVVVGMYPPSFQRGSSVPEGIEVFCFPDADVLVSRVTETPLACISPPSTGYVHRGRRRPAATHRHYRLNGAPSEFTVPWRFAGAVSPSRCR